ncbi:unnamed protein product, partial [Rotaria magnacalcarata]
NDRLRPSNLTNNEYHFLKLAESNSFLIVTTIEPKSFRIILVTDAINRLLNVTQDSIHSQSQRMSLNRHIGLPVYFECRLKSNNHHMYSSVAIDDFIHNNEQPLLHQTLLDSIRATSNRSTICHLIHPTWQILIPISVEIKPFFNAVTHQVYFIELTFKSLTQ